MPETIAVTMSTAVGPSYRTSASFALQVEAYDVISVSIAKGATDVKVELGTGADTVRLLQITAAEYGDAAKHVKYKLEGSTGHPLTAPVLLVNGAVGLLSSTTPASLLFSNSLDKDILVSILVGRDATP